MPTVRERLASLGTELGEFNQGDFRGRYTAIEGQAITDGYCAGVCLDWARRVLQSDSTRVQRNPAFVNYGSPKNSQATARGTGSTRQVQTLRRMATAYGGQGASYVSESELTKLKKALTELAAMPGESVSVPNGHAKLILANFSLDPNPLDLRYVTAGTLEKSRIASMLAQTGTRSDPQHQPLAGGGREWGQFAGELDDRFDQIRDAEHRKRSSRSFSNLQVAHSVDQKSYASPGHWRGELRARGFRDGCCTIVGVGVPGETGHAVAVHQIGDDHRFFDPNFGAFKLSLDNLMIAFQHLFDDPYWTDDTGLDANKPVYRRRTNANQPPENSEWTRMSYTVFQLRPGT